MEFRLLGELEVAGDAGLLPLPGRKQRALLALFCLHAGETLSRDYLIDRLWDLPPENAPHALEVHISRLRKALQELDRDRRGLLVSRPGGYALLVERELVDVGRAERLIADARQALAADDVAGAAGRLTEARSLWRGDPLPDLAFEPFADVELGRLDELRLTTLEDLADARLRLGHNAEVAVELEPLVALHPLRERLRSLLMLALYRCDRQAEALDIYHEGRRLLVGQLGIEPGESMQQLQQAILRHDSALKSPSADGASLSSAPTAAPSRAAVLPFSDGAPVRRRAGSLRALRFRRRRRTVPATEALAWDVYASSRIAPGEARMELAALGGALAVAARAAGDADALLADVDRRQLSQRLRKIRAGPLVERTVAEAAPIARRLGAVEALNEQRQRFESESRQLAVRCSVLIDTVFQARFDQTSPSGLAAEVHQLLEGVRSLTAALVDACTRLGAERP